jgi:hypothetical protein
MPDSSANPEITITTTIDPEGALAGAAATTEAIKKVGDAAESEGGRFDASILANRRSVTHLLRGLLELNEGGVAAIGGLATEGFVAAEGFEALLGPLFPLIAAVTLFGSVGIPIFERLGQKAGEHNSKLDDAKTKTGDLTVATQDLEKQAAISYPNILTMLQAQTSEMLKQVAAQKDLQRAKDELQDAQMAGKIADLDDQEEKDLVGKSEGEQAAIKRDYEKRRIALRQEQQRQQANEELTAKQQAAADARKAIEDQENEAKAEGMKLEQAYAVLHGGADAQLAQAGVKSDAEIAADRKAELERLAAQTTPTGDYRGMSPDETIEYENLQRSVPQLQSKEAADGKSFDGQLEALKKQKADAEQEEAKDLDPSFTQKLTDPDLIFNNQQRAQNARATADKATAQIQAIEEYIASINAGRKVIEEGVPKFQDLNNAIPVLTKKAETADTLVDVAQQKVNNLQTVQNTETAKITAQQAREIAKEEYQKRAAERETEQGKIEAELKNPNLNVPGREDLQQQLENLKKKGDQDQLDNAIPLGLTDAEIIKLKGLQSSSQISTTYTSEAEQKRAAEQQARANSRDTRTDITGDGREAIQDMQSLGASKQDIEQAKSAVSQMGQGHAEAAASLLGILEHFTGSVNNLSAANTEVFNSLMAKIQALDRALATETETRKRVTDSIRNGMAN